MILAVDVHYAGDGSAMAAGVLFGQWADAVPAKALRSRVPQVAAYAPGEFYRRELPCLLALLREHALQPSCIVVDGYVHLDEEQQRPGLGQHLFEALEGKVPVIGVAKTRFAGIGGVHELLRGHSARPLYVTSAGVSLEQAKAQVRAMHGDHRIPAMLKAADQLCRQAA